MIWAVVEVTLSQDMALALLLTKPPWELRSTRFQGDLSKCQSRGRDAMAKLRWGHLKAEMNLFHLGKLSECAGSSGTALFYGSVDTLVLDAVKM